MIAFVGADAADDLARVHARTFARPWGRDELLKLFDNPAVMAIAARAEEVIGFVLLWAAAGDAEVLTLAVVPEARRKGAAAALMAAASAAAKARGAAAVHLDVAADNEAARALYAKLGYQEAGRRRGYYMLEGKAVDAIVLRLELDPGGA